MKLSGVYFFISDSKKVGNCLEYMLSSWDSKSKEKGELKEINGCFT